jgi:hypothetical protein
MLSLAVYIISKIVERVQVAQTGQWKESLLVMKDGV